MALLATKPTQPFGERICALNTELGIWEGCREVGPLVLAHLPALSDGRGAAAVAEKEGAARTANDIADRRPQ